MNRDHPRKDTILLAEDNENDVVLLARVLKEINCTYPLKTAPDGQQTIDYLSGHGVFSDRERFPFPSLLILDMKLPVISGEGVLDWLRENAVPEKLLVIIVSGASVAKPAEQLIELNDKVCIFHSRFIKPMRVQNVEMMLKFYQAWKSRGGLR